MISELTGGRVPVKLWTQVEGVESAALDQLRRVARLPWVAHHVAVMPDVHYGKGATVGSVIAMKGAVSPAAVGVDIGCGMAAVKTNLSIHQLPDNLAKLRADIEARIPMGFNSNTILRSGPLVEDLFSKFRELHPSVHDLEGRARAQVGSLGGGNHFIELCIDTDEGVWMMLHSGSRNIGKELAEIHMTIARELGHNQGLEDRELAVFLEGTPEMHAYYHDLSWAQDYAFLNRRSMLQTCRAIMQEHFPAIEFKPAVQCHHNYLSYEEHYGEDLYITRKGAIRARPFEMGIIPGSMGSRSYIVRGLGNPESFESASHGAGRRMSRGAAKRQFTLDDLAQQTAGVECRKDGGVLDEIPGAYKSIEEVMQNQSDLVEIVAELKGVLCCKG